MNRRQFLKSAAALTGGIFVADAAFEARGLTITRHEVSSPTLPPALDGLRIAQLSDLHLPCAAAEHAAAALTADPVDVVVITGDTISHHRQLPLVTPYVARARGRLATLAVRGNNDHWAKVSVPTLSAAYAAAGARLLENAHAVVERDGAALQFVGLDDPAVGHPDIHAALRGSDPSLPSVWLLHSPGYIDRIVPLLRRCRRPCWCSPATRTAGRSAARAARRWCRAPRAASARAFTTRRSAASTSAAASAPAWCRCAFSARPSCPSSRSDVAPRDNAAWHRAGVSAVSAPCVRCTAGYENRRAFPNVGECPTRNLSKLRRVLAGTSLAMRRDGCPASAPASARTS